MKGPGKGSGLRRIGELIQPVACLKGIGPARASLLAQKGIRTVLDFLLYTPVRYEDRRRICPLRQAATGEKVLVKGRVIAGGEERFRRSGKGLFKILLQDGAETLELVWFHYRKPYLAGLANPKNTLLAYGQIQGSRLRRQMIHPEIRAADPDGVKESEALAIYPVYSAVRGLSAAALRTAIHSALTQHLPDLIDPVPRAITRELGLPDLATAIRNVHRPPAISSLEDLNDFSTPDHRRLLFDRFFLVMLEIASLKARRGKMSVPAWSIPGSFRDQLRRWLPFDLTSDQWKAVRDVEADLSSGKAMNRLLLGDVGCGKTVVAAVAAHLCVRNGRQVAVMTPTQILARQHLEYFQALPEEMAFRPTLLTGRLKKAEKEETLRKMRAGETNLVVGTQSLLQEEVVFSKLGLVIIDEQQRFGVRERAMLDRKGFAAHQLVMTATPIPRTLAVALYADTEISLIEQIPGNRMPVLTRIVRESEKRSVLDALNQRLAGGQQGFVVCPAIEGSVEGEIKDAVDMAQKLKRILSPSHRVGLIHGRLSPEEREGVMEAFRKGHLAVLVGTTVIEVGVHVPGATVMIIEHPDRFGLSQLHQLRGRVGRGTEPGLCFLMASHNLPEKAGLRLQALVENQNGFEIALKDMQQRGYGQFAGLRQAGGGELDLSEMLQESELLFKAREAATGIIAGDPELSSPEHAPLRAFVDSMFSGPLDI